MTALPPLPPSGILDARVRVSGIDTWLVPHSVATDYTMTVQGTEVKLGWDMPEVESGRWELVLANDIVPLTSRGSIDLNTHDGPVRLTLRRLASALPGESSLAQNYPNPFNPSTTIRYELKENGPVELGVYDIAGQLIRQLVVRQQPAGRYTTSWDGRNAAGAQMATGVYLYALRADGFRSVRKMVLMK